MTWALQRSLASGEITPGLFGNSQSPQYLNGMREFQNGFITRQGGAQKRWGTRYLDSTQGDLPAKLALFRMRQPIGGTNTIGDYMIEITSAKIRAWNLATEVVFDISASSPYADADIPNLQIATAPDIMVITHENFEPRILKSPLSSLDIIDTEDSGPQYGVGLKSITLARASENLGGIGGANNRYRYESSESLFVKSTDQHSVWQVQKGFIRALEVVDGTTLLVEELEIAPTSSDNIGTAPTPGQFQYQAVGPTLDWEGPWIRQADSGANITVAVNFVAGDIIELDASTTIFTDEATDVGRMIDFNAGITGGPNLLIGLIVKFTSTTLVDVFVIRGSGAPFTGVDSAFLDIAARDVPDGVTMKIDQLTGSGATLTAAGANVFDATMDDGTERFPVFYLNGGAARITATGGGTTATATTIKDMSSTQVTSRWGQGWGPFVGFPRACAFHQDRLVFGGVERFPNSVAGSKNGRHENFSPGAIADDGFVLRLTSGRGTRISWLSSAGPDLLVGSEDDEHRIEGLPLSSGSLRASVQSSYGSSPVQPLLIGRNVLFADRERRSIWEMGFRFESERYESEDLTDLADHLFQTSTIRELAYFKRGEQLVLVVMEDGSVRCLTYKRGNGVLGWSPWTTGDDGKVLSAAAAPDAAEDRIWMVIERTINSVTKRYIEIFEPNNIEMDSYLKQTGQTSTTVTGLTHLALETVQVMQDDVYAGDFPVSATGTILLDSAPTDKVEVGLKIPFKMRPNYIAVSPTEDEGSPYGRLKKITAVNVMVSDSFGGKIEGSPAARINLDQTVTAPTARFTGWIAIDVAQVYGTDPTVLITHDTPHRFEVLAVNTHTEIGED